VIRSVGRLLPQLLLFSGSVYSSSHKVLDVSPSISSGHRTFTQLYVPELCEPLTCDSLQENVDAIEESRCRRFVVLVSRWRVYAAGMCRTSCRWCAEQRVESKFKVGITRCAHETVATGARTRAFSVTLRVCVVFLLKQKPFGTAPSFTSIISKIIDLPIGRRFTRRRI